MKMTKALFGVLTITLALSAQVQAQYYYSVNADDTLTITGYTGAGGAVAIPAAINNLPVTSIGSNAFMMTESLTSVMIPDGVTSIGEGAFALCDKLSSVTIPGSVRTIGEGAFYNCGLTSVTIASGLIIVGEYAFAGCQNLTSITVPASVSSVGEYAFYYCGGRLTSVYFQGNAPTADNSVFMDADNVTVYYLAGTTGWSSTFAGRPAKLGSQPTQTSALKVTISPASAITAGATWQVDGGTLQNSGTTVSGLSVGFHTVSFSAISGWTTPGNQSVLVSANSTATMTGTYVVISQTGSLHTPTTLSIALTATYQLPDKTSGGGGSITTSTTKAGSLTSKSILKLIETSLGTSFPNGTYLAQDGGIVEALDKAGYCTNLSVYMTINTSGAAVVSGSTNSVMGKQNSSGAGYTIIRFNDGKGNAFAVDGLVRETISTTAKNAKGDQTETVMFSGTVDGYGTVVDGQGNTDAAVFSGTIAGSGKGTPGS
jgi:hypothetical protein